MGVSRDRAEQFSYVAVLRAPDLPTWTPEGSMQQSSLVPNLLSEDLDMSRISGLFLRSKLAFGRLLDVLKSQSGALFAKGHLGIVGRVESVKTYLKKRVRH